MRLDLVLRLAGRDELFAHTLRRASVSLSQATAESDVLPLTLWTSRFPRESDGCAELGPRRTGVQLLTYASGLQ